MTFFATRKNTLTKEFVICSKHHFATPDKHASIGSSPFEVVRAALRALAFAEFQGGRWGFSGNVAPLTPLGRKSLAPDSTFLPPHLMTNSR